MARQIQAGDQSRILLSPRDRRKVGDWIEEHWEEIVEGRMNATSVAARVRKDLELPVNHNHVRRIAQKDLGKRIGRYGSNGQKESATKIIAQQVAILALKLGEKPEPAFQKLVDSL